MNVSVPTKLMLNPERSKQYFSVKIDPELLSLRGEKAHCETFLAPEGDCYGRMVLPSRVVPLPIFCHELTHLAIDVATLYIPALEGETEAQTVERKHEAAATIVENILGQVKFIPKKD